MAPLVKPARQITIRKSHGHCAISGDVGSSIEIIDIVPDYDLNLMTLKNA